MASYRIGNGYEGSSDLQTSTANMEVCPPKPQNWSVPYSFYKFSFENDQATKVKVNNGKPIYLRAGQGFEVSIEDAPITSFVIVDAGVTFNWVAAY